MPNQSSRWPFMPRLIGLLSLCLLPFLTACAHNAQIVKQAPPTELLRPCPTVLFNVKTNADLASYALSLRSSLEDCDADKAALRKMYQPDLQEK